jgi:hypothetical protein
MKEVPMNCGFLLHIIICSCVCSTPRDARCVDAFAAAKASAVTNSPSQNFFAHSHPKSLFGGLRRAQNARIGITDSFLQRRSPSFWVAHSVRAPSILVADDRTQPVAREVRGNGGDVCRA